MQADVYRIRVLRGVNVRTGGLLALFLCGTALRPQLVGVSPLIADIERDLGLSHAVTGLLTAVPLVCMGAFAFLGAPIARATSSRSAITISLALLTAFGVIRSAFTQPALILVATAGVGVGIALAGAVLPQVVKETFADEPVRATGTYSAGIQVGSTVAAAVAVPIALAFAGWRWSLAAFAGFTGVVLIAWLALAPAAVPSPPIKAGSMPGFERTLLLALTFATFGAAYYGLITWLPEIYLREGWSPAQSGALLGALNAAAMIGGFAVALGSGRRRAGYPIVLLLSGVFAASLTGFFIAPALAIVWALLAGFTNGALLPLVLALPLELSSQPAVVARVTAVMLGAGYMIAATTPIVLGFLRDASGGFQASKTALVVIGWIFFVAVTAAVGTRARRL